MKRFESIVLLLLVYGVINSNAQSSCNCVAFRLDDIQDFYITTAQMTIMNIFKASKIPLTVGVISNNFGLDTNIVNAINQNLADTEWDFEIANHGWKHENFSLYSYEYQKDILQQALKKTINQLKPRVNAIPTFVPPLNEFNSDTIRAVKETGFKTMSSMNVIDHPPYPTFDSNSDLFRWPIGASTGDLNNTLYFNGVEAEITFSQIQSQLQHFGYAAVMMHPQEFSIKNSTNNKPTPVVDQVQVNRLMSVINMVVNAGYKLVTIGGIRDAFAGTYNMSGRRGNENNGVVYDPYTYPTTGIDITTNSEVTPSSTTATNTPQPSSTTGSVGSTTGLVVPPSLTTGSTTGESCAVGSLNCNCDQDNTCEIGLECKSESNICVESEQSSSSNPLVLSLSLLCISMLSQIL